MTQLGRGYGITRKVVKRIEVVARQRLHRPALPSYPGRIAPSEWATILARLDAGETFDRLAHDYGVAPVTIRRLEKLARKALGAGEPPRYRHWSIPPSEWPTIVARIEQGASQRQLAKEYGVSASTIKVVLREAKRSPYQDPTQLLEEPAHEMCNELSSSKGINTGSPLTLQENEG